MRYDPGTRVLSLSFARDPEEHTDVMLEAGRRMMSQADTVRPGTAILVAIGFGVAVGIVMELHRRIVLPSVLGSSEVAPLGTVALQLLPLILLFAALYAVLHVRTTRRRRRAMISRLQPNHFVDVDIFSGGVSTSAAQARVEVDWSGVRDIIADGGRIELECESFVIYIPTRAFENYAAYAEALKAMRRLWHDAVKLDHDRRMVAAGLD